MITRLSYEAASGLVARSAIPLAHASIVPHRAGHRTSSREYVAASRELTRIWSSYTPGGEASIDEAFLDVQACRPLTTCLPLQPH